MATEYYRTRTPKQCRSPRYQGYWVEPFCVYYLEDSPQNVPPPNHHLDEYTPVIKPTRNRTQSTKITQNHVDRSCSSWTRSHQATTDECLTSQPSNYWRMGHDDSIMDSSICFSGSFGTPALQVF